MTKDTGPSGMKVWVTLPGKANTCQMLAEGGGNTEWRKVVRNTS